MENNISTFLSSQRRPTTRCETQHTDWTYELLADAMCSVIA
jgi:hypothetical protein